MIKYTILPRRYWQHKITGQTVSIFGAVPYLNDSDKTHWEIVSKGYVYRDERTGTIHGNNNKPFFFSTREEVRSVLTRWVMPEEIEG